MIFKNYLVENNIDIIKQNLTLFYGENIGLQNDLKKKIRLSDGEAELIKFTQDEILKNKNQFYSEINNKSLFKEKKIYFIDQTNDKILEIIKDIASRLDQQKIYLFSGLLDRKSKLRNYFEKSQNTASVACYADNDLNIKKIIQEKLKNFDGLSSENINIIADSCNLDRIKLNNELDKIITYFINKKIKRDKLELLLDIKINDNFNLLKDAALSGDKTNTNKLLSDTVIDDDKNVLYLNIINQRLNKLLETTVLAKNANLENAISMIRPPIFWKDKPMFIAQSKKWNLNKIKKIMGETYNLEIEIKSNPIVQKNILIKKLLVDICEQANAL